MHPGALLSRTRTDFRGWIERARVYVAGLDADDSALAEPRQFVRAHAPLAVRFHARHALASEILPGLAP